MRTPARCFRRSVTSLVLAGLLILVGLPVGSLAQTSEIISPENADRVVEVSHWGRGVTSAVTYSADGRYLAVGSALGVYLYDLTLGTERLIDPGASVREVAFSPDSQMVATASASDLRLWRVVDGALLQTMPGGIGARVARVRWSLAPDLGWTQTSDPGADFFARWTHPGGGRARYLRRYSEV